MLTGSCLCGAINYQVMIDENIDTIVFCHCQRCRKWSGSAFNSAISIKATELSIVTGQDKINFFAINGVNRYFCSECGSNLFTTRDNNKDYYRLRAGTLDSPINVHQKIHIYTASKANWDTICDNGIEFSENINS